MAPQKKQILSARNQSLIKHKLISIPHPKDRKVDQLQRQILHNAKIEGYKNRRKQHDQLTATRMFWFRCQIEGPLASQPDDFYTPDVLEAMIQIHIERNDQEIADLKKGDVKKLHYGRINSLEEQRKFENSLFGTKGLSAPDLCDKEVREIMLEIWDGDVKLMNCVPQVNVIRRDHRSNRTVDEFEALKARLSALLTTIEEVRDQQAAAGVVASKSSNFRVNAPAQKTLALAAKQKSVKAVASGDQIAKSGAERRAMQSKKRQENARQLALAKHRGQA